ncbi:cytochrome c biogenesis CcdA family protein [Mycobacterium sp. 141]|uniref:cytochrome c biogenesis CcdA family protein n=1 Tax=Mycobacterium sp. 141 TaxID=1120797 RepID=UPI00035C1C27|nr:cytochrome c biogenesis CcdA family protein [Mycobacterium sp. 141]
MTGIGFLGAFLGGVASLLSPCSAMLLPSFFAYAFDRVQVLMRRTLAFWAGMCLVFVPLGAGVGALGGAITRYRSELTTVGGLVLIGLGVVTLFGRGFALPGIQRLTARIDISGTMSVLALGAVYGLAGFCSGPLLGAVLTMSAMGADPVYGGLLMAVYALGMTAPLFLLAWMWNRLRLSERSWLRGRPIQLGPVRTHTTSLLSGLILIVLGVAFLLTDGTASLGSVLTVDSEYDLQVWLAKLSSHINDAVLILLVAAVLIGWRLIRARRRRTRLPANSDSTETSEAPNETGYDRASGVRTADGRRETNSSGPEISQRAGSDSES